MMEHLGFRSIVINMLVLEESDNVRYYGYIGRTTGVYDSWSKVHDKIVQYPYSKYRVFKTEDAAYRFIQNTPHLKPVDKVTTIGFADKEFAIDVEYYVWEGKLYVNLYIPDNMYTQFQLPIQHISRTIACYSDPKGYYRNDTAKGQVQICKQILNLVGDFVDVNLHVYDDTLYLLERFYVGTDTILTEYLESLKKRIGCLTYTFNTYNFKMQDVKHTGKKSPFDFSIM